jgi:hypothetical protein
LLNGCTTKELYDKFIEEKHAEEAK